MQLKNLAAKFKPRSCFDQIPKIILRKPSASIDMSKASKRKNAGELRKENSKVWSRDSLVTSLLFTQRICSGRISLRTTQTSSLATTAMSPLILLLHKLAQARKRMSKMTRKS